MATPVPSTRLKGFARLSPERRREIARRAGLASGRSPNHARFTTESARAARRLRARVRKQEEVA